jgi:polysaccharide export outer membrane protein
MKAFRKTSVLNATRLVRRLPWIASAALALVILTGAGCQAPTSAADTTDDQHADIILREGDVVKVSFPGAQDLDPREPLQIRTDGKITLPIIGEITAAGLTPTQLQDQLVGLYSKQLVDKEVVVTVVSSSFVVYVDGAVLRSGPISTNHPITILEALMQAGIDYDKADTSAIQVTRLKPGAKGYTYYYENLKPALSGQGGPLFYLAPGDMVHVPTKFNWF